MKASWLILPSVLALFMALVAAPRAQASEDGGNGVYGGYVASDSWFAEMRHSAANQAMLRSLSGSTGRSGRRAASRLPAGYVECAVELHFPYGNPFPKGQLPDLRLTCANEHADPVERAPHLSPQYTFYSVLQRGQTYEMEWMYYFGAHEKFARVSISPEGPTRRHYVVDYLPQGAVAQASESGSAGMVPAGGPGVVGQAGTPGTAGMVPASAPPASEASMTHAPSGAATEAIHVLISAAQAAQFDLSGVVQPPTTFEEQQVLEAVHSARTPALKAEAHERLARFYDRKGAAAKARAERERAAYWNEQTRRVAESSGR